VIEVESRFGAARVVANPRIGVVVYVRRIRVTGRVRVVGCRSSLSLRLLRRLLSLRLLRRLLSLRLLRRLLPRLLPRLRLRLPLCGRRDGTSRRNVASADRLPRRLVLRRLRGCAPRRFRLTTAALRARGVRQQRRERHDEQGRTHMLH
jgi:hypothetical protein